MKRLSKEQILMLHSQLIEQTGGIDGVRDFTLLESAIETPFQVFAGEELYPTIQAKGTRIGYGLIKNHCMLDGNKRIGTHAMLVFFALNGIELQYTQKELYEMVLAKSNSKIESNIELQINFVISPKIRYTSKQNSIADFLFYRKQKREAKIIMAKTVGIGIQSFGEVIEGNYFYIDKTPFIKEWWESGDSVTLIARPRRFGKTLNMSMLEQFFSVEYKDRGDLFEGLEIWKEEKYRQLQGTYPVISLSFANIKEKSYEATRKKICQLITKLYAQNSFLLDSGILYKSDIDYFNRVSEKMDDSDASLALYQLSDYLQRYYGKKVIILLDEYDTPMQEAYVQGFWDELVAFTRSLFNSTFKTNPYLARAVMTGITRVSKESIFSDLNNLEVVTTTSNKYATSFGFTEIEVFGALEERGMGTEKEEVKTWYDGFVFGEQKDIYNPWSILNFLDKGKISTYWANTSSNSLVGKLIREGNRKIKAAFECLLRGETIQCPIDEQVVYNRLGDNEAAVFSLLLASGYLKVLKYEHFDKIPIGKRPRYELELTNLEVRSMFFGMVQEWFYEAEDDYSDFIKALLTGDIKAMNIYMNRVTLQTFSYFDTGKGPFGDEPERFYHGFVLGLLAELNERYVITSNRESGFGRYDVMLEPKNKDDQAMILEFKVHDAEDEASLKDTVAAALAQIEEKQYEADLLAKGFEKQQIRKYGFAFEGKKVLIG